ncbi:hypothetical protein HHK36_030378 [Tetracentron sinense]|uniref:Uncharacterized protein n=1 Tax=Tetracentron sinense TaxID=13715 RepID=A0A835D0K2_TETSI|nr:hypothetical protein HHK36_030378 [Tetracentron sinense]
MREGSLLVAKVVVVRSAILWARSASWKQVMVLSDAKDLYQTFRLEAGTLDMPTPDVPAPNMPTSDLPAAASFSSNESKGQPMLLDPTFIAITSATSLAKFVCLRYLCISVPKNPHALGLLGNTLPKFLRRESFAFRFSSNMAKGSTGRRRLASRRYRPTPYPLPYGRREVLGKVVHQQKKCATALDKKDWEDATCSVCMEYPHNAVLLLCSSHDKGCRPYMCGTSYRYSNCLDQYKKAYTKVASPHHGQPWYGPSDDSGIGSVSGWPSEKCEVTELACPLCRGQVKGWTVVESARDYLNTKKRSCMQDDCSFVGTYKELRKHVKAEHPSARPREVDPILEQKWSSLERERERNDVISTIRSSMPGAMVLGDYVIEGNHHDFDTDDEERDAAEGDGGVDDNLLNFLFLFQAFGSAENASLNTHLRRLERGYHRTLDEGSVGIRHAAAVGGVAEPGRDNDDDMAQVVLRRRVLFGRSRRRGRIEARRGRDA